MKLSMGGRGWDTCFAIFGGGRFGTYFYFGHQDSETATDFQLFKK